MEVLQVRLSDGGSSGSNRVSIDADVPVVYVVDDYLLIADPDRHSHPVQKGDLLLVNAPRQGIWSFSGASAIVTRLAQAWAGLDPLHLGIEAICEKSEAFLSIFVTREE